MAYTTDQYEGMIAETVMMPGHNGDWINAYYARPAGPGPFPGMVLIHHMPGWDEWYREATRKFAHHGYATISPNLYFRAGHGTPDEVTAAHPRRGRRRTMTRPSATSRARPVSCGHCRTATARSASSARARAAGTPTWPPARRPSSTRW